jgi:hypothetical protein
MTEATPLIAKWTAFRCPDGHLYAVALRDIFTGDPANASDFEFAPGQPQVEVRCYCGFGVRSIQRMMLAPDERARFDAFWGDK